MTKKEQWQKAVQETNLIMLFLWNSTTTDKDTMPVTANTLRRLVRWNEKILQRLSRAAAARRELRKLYERVHFYKMEAAYWRAKCKAADQWQEGQTLAEFLGLED